MDSRTGVCRECGAQFKIPASFKPDRARCRQCGGVVRVGPQGGALPAPDPAPRPVERPRRSPSARPERGAEDAQSRSAERDRGAENVARSGRRELEERDDRDPDAPIPPSPSASIDGAIPVASAAAQVPARAARAPVRAAGARTTRVQDSKPLADGSALPVKDEAVEPPAKRRRSRRRGLGLFILAVAVTAIALWLWKSASAHAGTTQAAPSVSTPPSSDDHGASSGPHEGN